MCWRSREARTCAAHSTIVSAAQAWWCRPGGLESQWIWVLVSVKGGGSIGGSRVGAVSSREGEQPWFFSEFSGSAIGKCYLLWGRGSSLLQTCQEACLFFGSRSSEVDDQDKWSHGVSLSHWHSFIQTLTPNQKAVDQTLFTLWIVSSFPFMVMD